MIVVDVGAARYGGDYSVERLVDQFHPRMLYAIDPNDAVKDLPPIVEDTKIEVIQAAAWTRDGELGFRADGLNSWVTIPTPSTPKVRAIDLARFITELSEIHDDRLVLKLDCEGSEYEILPHLITHDVDELLDTVIVEWHPKLEPQSDVLRERIESRLRCEVMEWPY